MIVTLINNIIIRWQSNYVSAEEFLECICYVRSFLFNLSCVCGGGGSVGKGERPKRPSMVCGPSSSQ